MDVNEDKVSVDGLNYKSKLLGAAYNIVNGDRNVQYGEPDADFKRTAELWSTYIQGVFNRQASEQRQLTFEAQDVAIMMILLKISRLTWSPGKEDSWLDIAGYAACGWDTVNRNPNIKLC